MQRLGTAVVAAVAVTAKGRRAAAGDGAQRLVLHAAQAVCLLIVRSVGADDVTERQCRRRCFRCVAVLAHLRGQSMRQVEQFQRRGVTGQVRPGEVEVEQRGADLTMAK